MSHEAAAVADHPPHVLIFPLPLQGHINSMLKLAELLCFSGLHITLLLSEYTHSRLHLDAKLKHHFAGYPGFAIAAISDGLPEDHPRTAMDTIFSLLRVGEGEFRKVMQDTDALRNGGARRRVSCLIMDGLLSAVVPVAKEMCIPFLYFRTVSACSFWAYYCFEKVIQAGEVPLKGKDEDKYSYIKRPDMDLPVTAVPGMESFLRRRDLPSFCRVSDLKDTGFTTLITETLATSESHGLILNSFEDLEGQILDQIRKTIPNLFSVGPLHTHLQARKSEPLYSSSFWEEDRTAVVWLDSQPAGSVRYVSFGSITLLTRDELLEIWYGLVKSGQRFLWVMRPDSIEGGGGETVPAELEEGTKERGYIVGWVAQKEVLAHPAIGAFLTHSGWNSTLESVASGKPMICWPYFADQTINSRFVSEVWKVGVDMKDTGDRATVEMMVRDVMVDRKDELLARAARLAQLANKAVRPGGTSYHNLDRLLEYFEACI